MVEGSMLLIRDSVHMVLFGLLNVVPREVRGAGAEISCARAVLV